VKFLTIMLYQNVAIWTINLLILVVIIDLIIIHFFWFIKIS
jgi:hypothetical protein